MIPECGILPEVLKSTIADVREYYLVRNLPVHELVAHEFIDAFVKKGKELIHLLFFMLGSFLKERKKKY